VRVRTVHFFELDWTQAACGAWFTDVDPNWSNRWGRVTCPECRATILPADRSPAAIEAWLDA